MDTWDPAQYGRFEQERARPFWDLATMVDTEGEIVRMADLGCGTGELTAQLAHRLGAARALGVDTSEAMLAAARPHADDVVTFEHGDIGAWTAAGEMDLVFSNAALHWVADHPSVLARWRDALRPGGQLAVQVPYNADHPAPQAAVRVAGSEPFFSALDQSPPPDAVTANVLAPSRYAEVLHELGFTTQTVRAQVYGHVLPDHDAVIEWIRGSTLTRFFAVLPEELHDPFVDAVREEYRASVPPSQPVFYPFQRILMWGRLRHS